MPIPVTCPSCGTVLSAPDSAAGKRAKCRTCQTILTIPDPTPGFEILDDATTVAEMPLKAVLAPAAYVPPAVAVPAPAAFALDEPAPKAKKRAIVDDDDAEEEDRPRKKRRRDEDDEENERPRSRKGKAEKKGNAIVYILVAALALFLILIVGIVGVWYTLIREKPVTVDTSILLKPKPTVQTKSTGRTAPKDWETVDDGDFQAFLPKTGYNLEKIDLPLSKSEDFPELGEARLVGKSVARNVKVLICIFSIRRESLAKVNKDPKAAVGTWSDIFLIKVPTDDVTITDFNNPEFNYKGRQYTFKDEDGVKFYYRMFVANERFYVLRVLGDDINERTDYVKTFFESFNPTK